MPYYLSYAFHIAFRFLTDQFRKQPEVQHVYMKSHCRSGGYIVGITAAFVLRHFKKTDCKLSKVRTPGTVSRQNVLNTVIFVTVPKRAHCFPTNYFILQNITDVISSLS